jgi:hypothetical protein
VLSRRLQAAPSSLAQDPAAQSHWMLKEKEKDKECARETVSASV